MYFEHSALHVRVSFFEGDEAWVGVVEKIQRELIYSPELYCSFRRLHLVDLIFV